MTTTELIAWPDAQETRISELTQQLESEASEAQRQMEQVAASRSDAEVRVPVVLFVSCWCMRRTLLLLTCGVY